MRVIYKKAQGSQTTTPNLYNIFCPNEKCGVKLGDTLEKQCRPRTCPECGTELSYCMLDEQLEEALRAPKEVYYSRPS